LHTIEPFERWLNYYNPAFDESSPFFGKEYNYDLYSDTIYNYYIDPAWDYMGSETLYIKILYADYMEKYAIIELMGEWNDAIGNDIMFLKRNVIDHFTYNQVNKFILIGENVFNFHGSDDCYYEEWYEDLEEGWIAGINFRSFVIEEWRKYNVDYYINFGGELEIDNWRTFSPAKLFDKVASIIHRRIDLI